MTNKLFDENVIAILWDFDQTLIPGSMQQVLFDHFGVDGEKFWQEVKQKQKEALMQLPARPREAPFFSESINYLNHILDYTHDERFPKLNNGLLRELGTKLEFFDGIPDVFKRLKKVAKKCSDKSFQCHVEHYVVSCGLRQMILGSKIASCFDGVWGCEFEEKEVDGENVLSRIHYVLDDTTKTRAIFEINKGSNIRSDIDLNAYLPKEKRRVPISQMIYVADGPSDVPVFSVIKSGKGKGLVVHAKGRHKKAYELHQKERRGDHYSLADYSEDSDACLWLEETVHDMVTHMRTEHSRSVREQVGKGAPAH